jgi:hypothetical protein
MLGKLFYDFMQASYSGRTISNIPPERSAAQFSSPLQPARKRFKTMCPISRCFKFRVQPETNPRRASGSKLNTALKPEQKQLNIVTQDVVRLKESNHAKPTPTTTA